MGPQNRMFSARCMLELCWNLLEKTAGYCKAISIAEADRLTDRRLGSLFLSGFLLIFRLGVRRATRGTGNVSL
jgi:hypothetical protein